MASERLQVILELVTGQYKREAKEAATATGKIGDAASHLTDRLTGVGSAMTTAGRAMAGFGAAVVGGLGLAAKATIDWESAFAGVRKTVEGTTSELAALEQGLLDLSLVTPVSAEELAGIAESAGQLGIATENILSFTESMAALGVTTNLTAEEAATGFAQLANIMKTPQTQFENLASALVDLGNKGASTEKDILDFALRLAGAGEIAGLTEAQVLGIGSAMASVGVEAEAGGTAVQKVLIAMTQAVATGNEDLAVFAETAGLSASEFTAAWQTDPGNAFALFVEGLGRAGDDAFTILENLDLQDQRLIRSFLSLAGAGDLLRQNLDDGTAAFAENTAASEEAQKRYETIASELQILVNAVKVLAIEVGNTLLPAIRAGADVAQSLVKWFTDMPEPIRIATVMLTGLVGGLSLLGGAALIVVPKIVATIKAVRDLRLAIIALRAANLPGAIGGAAGSGTASAVGGVRFFGWGSVSSCRCRYGSQRIVRRNHWSRN